MVVHRPSIWCTRLPWPCLRAQQQRGDSARARALLGPASTDRTRRSPSRATCRRRSSDARVPVRCALAASSRDRWEQWPTTVQRRLRWTGRVFNFDQVTGTRPPQANTERGNGGTNGECSGHLCRTSSFAVLVALPPGVGSNQRSQECEPKVWPFFAACRRSSPSSSTSSTPARGHAASE